MPSLQAALKSPALFLLPMAGLLAAATLGLSQETVEQNEPGATEIRALRNRALTLLSSDGKRDQAWGAWYMAHHHFTDLADIAEGVLTKELASEKKVDHLLLSALIDGLIQNRRQTRPELLSAIWNRGYRVEAIAMAAADAGKTGPFLASLLNVEMCQQEHMAVCNLLSGQAPRLFVDTVLPRIQQLALTVEVVLSEDVLRRGGGGGRYGTSYGDGVIERDVNLPPRVNYKLSLFPHNGGVVLANGPETVYLERRVYWETGGCGSHRTSMTGSDARDYWRKCLVHQAYDTGVDREELNLRWNRKITIPWTDLAALRKSVILARADLRAPWLELCRSLQRKEFLPAGMEVGKLFPVKVELVDRRAEKDGPLPRIEDLLDKDAPPRN